MLIIYLILFLLIIFCFEWKKTTTESFVDLTTNNKVYIQMIIKTKNGTKVYSIYEDGLFCFDKFYCLVVTNKNIIQRLFNVSNNSIFRKIRNVPRECHCNCPEKMVYFSKKNSEYNFDVRLSDTPSEFINLWSELLDYVENQKSTLQRMNIIRHPDTRTVLL